MDDRASTVGGVSATDCVPEIAAEVPRGTGADPGKKIRLLRCNLLAEAFRVFHHRRTLRRTVDLENLRSQFGGGHGLESVLPIGAVVVGARCLTAPSAVAGRA